MKLQFLLLLLFVSAFTHAQIILEGTYCKKIGWLGECYTFKADNSFEYYFWSCIGGKKGNGTYSLESRKLTLTFSGEKKELKNSFTTQTLNCGYIDSISIDFLVNDAETNSPLPYASIFLPTVPQIMTTDSLGHAYTKFKSSNNFEVRVSYAGFKPFYSKLSISNCMNVNINLVSTDTIFGNGTQWTYSVKKIKPDKLKLQTGKDYITLLKSEK